MPAAAGLPVEAARQHLDCPSGSIDDRSVEHGRGWLGCAIGGVSRPAWRTRSRVSRLGRLAALAFLTLAAIASIAPQGASATALKGAESKAGPSGLPNGRVYEQASPQGKPGTEAGNPVGSVTKPTAPYMLAAANGDEVAYNNSGPIGETPTGFDLFSIAKHGSDGWSSRGAVSRGVGAQEAFWTNPQDGLGFAATELNASVFGAPDVFAEEQPIGSPTPHLYRYTESGAVEWIGKPTIAKPVKIQGFAGNEYGELAGASTDLDSIFYAFEGTLTPADEAPNPNLGGISRADAIRAINAGGGSSSDDGFYEWHDGTLTAAGVLPDGYLDPYGAMPAATLSAKNSINAEVLHDQVSESGDDAFFISPEPGASSGGPAELYDRQTAADGTQRTLLVSRDLTTPQVEREPAPAPDGVPAGASFYASPDGGHAFFASKDQLTADAPSGSAWKEYDFDTGNGTLTYLPGVDDLEEEKPIQLLDVSQAGTALLFLRAGELGLWSEGAITEIAAVASVAQARMSADGAVTAFQTKSPLSEFQFNNGAGKYEQIYRYEDATNTLDCVSCPPVGVTPNGSAEMDHDRGSGNIGNTLGGIMTGNRGLSEDGSRVFFDTTSPLAPQDTNGVRDVYEWEVGTNYLLSTGVSTEASFFGDNSPSGNDVFFSTSEGLLPGDDDEGYDVYDARVPRPSDQLLPEAVPCEGSVCQGPPSVPNLLSAPASEAFNGLGDLTPSQSASNGSDKTKKKFTRAQRLRNALRACKGRHAKSQAKQKRCMRQARKRYGAKIAPRKRNRHHNGRGK